jgi:hypothetical protein
MSLVSGAGTVRSRNLAARRNQFSKSSTSLGRGATGDDGLAAGRPEELKRRDYEKKIFSSGSRLHADAWLLISLFRFAA